MRGVVVNLSRGIDMLVRKLFYVVLLSLLSVNIHAAPKPEAISFWTTSNESSEQVVSHDAWQSLLDRYLSVKEGGVNLFNYKGVNDEDRKVLQDYLAALQAIDPRQLTKDEQFAYWVNMYNALTVEVVLDEYPVSSIKKIRFLSSPFGPWDKNFMTIQGEKLSLNDIEHGILRPIWQDPRIHFAVNCASIGCPNLMPTAFTAANADALMEQAAFDYIGHSRAFGLDGNTLKLSSIFEWYGDDFGSDQAEINEYLSDYTADDVDFDPSVSYKVKFDYDWSLNEVK